MEPERISFTVEFTAKAIKLFLFSLFWLMMMAIVVLLLMVILW